VRHCRGRNAKGILTVAIVVDPVAADLLSGIVRYADAQVAEAGAGIVGGAFAAASTTAIITTFQPVTGWFADFVRRKVRD